MNVKEYLDLVACEITRYEEWMSEPEKVYESKFDGSYITHVGMENRVQFLADHEITEELTCCTGFSPKENKWYGWSHRAIYGFTIGSTCTKGDAHYVADTFEDQTKDAISRWSDEHHLDVRLEDVCTDDAGSEYLVVKWEYSDTVPNEKLRGTTGYAQVYVPELGKGEWTAETMADAKQMAMDFVEGVG